MPTIQSPSTKQDILQHLLRQGKATAQELAKRLNLSPQGIRRHLKELQGEGFIEYQAIAGTMGRPQHVYSLSRQGSALFAHRYDDFAVSFLATLVETVGENQVSEVLKKQWQRKALAYRQQVGNGSLAERARRLVEIRQEEGYMAQLHEVDTSEPREYILTEHHCAIAEVAESYPSICGHELEMFSFVLPDCLVERTHWINQGEHRCGYLIRPFTK
jgi:DeoR family suf operon transcriptional repressor